MNTLASLYGWWCNWYLIAGPGLLVPLTGYLIVSVRRRARGVHQTRMARRTGRGKFTIRPIPALQIPPVGASTPATATTATTSTGRQPCELVQSVKARLAEHAAQGKALSIPPCLDIAMDDLDQALAELPGTATSMWSDLLQDHKREFSIAGGTAKLAKLVTPRGEIAAIKAFRTWGSDLAATYSLVDAVTESSHPLRRYFVPTALVPAGLMVRTAFAQGEPVVPVAVMEWLEYPLLHEYIVRHRIKVSGERTQLAMVARELRGLFQAMRAAGVVHGDYCQTNMFIAGVNGSPSVLLADYDSLSHADTWDSLARIIGHADFQHARRMNARDCVFECPLRVDAISEKILYLNVVAYCIIPDLPPPTEDGMPFTARIQHPGSQHIATALSRFDPALAEVIATLNRELAEDSYPNGISFLDESVTGNAALSALEERLLPQTRPPRSPHHDLSDRMRRRGNVTSSPFTIKPRQ